MNPFFPIKFVNVKQDMALLKVKPRDDWHTLPCSKLIINNASVEWWGGRGGGV